MASSAEQLILRGLNLVLRTTFAPNNPEAQARHVIALQADIGPWFSDYADEIAKPAVDFTITPVGGDGFHVAETTSEILR
jgi:hypothetical protein